MQSMTGFGHAEGTLKGMDLAVEVKTVNGRYLDVIARTPREMAALENCIRENLDHAAPRRMAVVRPLKVVLTNYPEDQTEEMSARNHPNRPDFGSRDLPFGREIYIEQTDFMEAAPRKFFRLKPGGEVRLP